MFEMSSRRMGKQAVAEAQVKFALDRGHAVIVACVDQKAATERWAAVFPGALFEVVGNWGLRIHRRKR